MKYKIIGICVLFFMSSPTQAQNEISSGELIPVNGTELFVKVIGKGEPLIVLHGGPGFSHHYLLPHLKPLSKNFRLILFDQRGMGNSSTQLNPESFTMDLLIDDIEALRTELELGKINLMAHSWGARLAMRYAMRYPNALKSMILSNSVAASSEFGEATFSAFSKLNERQNIEQLNTLLTKIRNGNREVEVFERFTQLNFRPLFYDTSRVNELQLHFADTYFETQGLLSNLPPPNQPYNLFPELEKVEVPVLVIRSEIEAVPIEADQKLANTLPNARLVNFSESGHFPFIERQEAFIDTVTQFVNEAGAGNR